MSWHEMNQQRRENRKNPGFRQGHHRRSKGFSALLEKKKYEDGHTEIVVVAQAKDGCFGNLAKFDKNLYEEWAEGTSGSKF